MRCAVGEGPLPDRERVKTGAPGCSGGGCNKSGGSDAVIAAGFLIDTRKWRLYFGHSSGCGSARLERVVWDHEVGGSNPLTPNDIQQYAPVAQLDRATAF